jgi:hypothetical protein
MEIDNLNRLGTPSPTITSIPTIEPRPTCTLTKTIVYGPVESKAMIMDQAEIPQVSHLTEGDVFVQRNYLREYASAIRKARFFKNVEIINDFFLSIQEKHPFLRHWMMYGYGELPTPSPSDYDELYPPIKNITPLKKLKLDA